MNNKGFTLIELIVTIALLAIISLISFVSVSSAIKKNKTNNCNTLVDNIKGAANEYVSDNRYNSAFVNVAKTNMSITINASDLISGHYLSSDKIKDPNDNKTDITSSVSAIVELNNDYTVKRVTVNGINCNN